MEKRYPLVIDPAGLRLPHAPHRRASMASRDVSQDGCPVRRIIARRR